MTSSAPPVCLTGDVHHMSMETRDQAHMDGTELEAALEYARIAEAYDLPVTLFVTGKAVVEEPGRVRALADMPHVELGGHDYWAFDTLAHTAFRGLTGSWNGPRPFQSWEIGRTLDALADLGVAVRSWRDHAYRHDANTPDILRDHGVTHFSDAVEPDGDVRGANGLTVVPINTPPDHEHVYHAFRTPEFVAGSDFEGPFGTESVEPGEWCEWVLETVESHAEAGRTATVLAHPACLRLADGFETFERLCERLGEYEPRKMSDL